MGMKFYSVGEKERVEYEKGLFKGLDIGIRDYVSILRSDGIETCQSCQGGPGHTYLEPTVDFLGGPGAGMMALGIALNHGFPVFEVRRVWRIDDGGIREALWSMTFHLRSDIWYKNTEARERRWLRLKKTGRGAI